MMKRTIITALLTLFIGMGTEIQAQDQLARVIVANEGNFGSGNATLTEYIPDSQQSTDGIFFNANGAPLGDVAQRVKIFDGKIYVVVNNSSKIEVLNAETYQQRASIDMGDKSPRDILRITSGKAYSTNLFDNSVSVIDLVTHQETGVTIHVGENPDRMILHEDRAYVANNGFGADSTIFVIDTASDEVTDTLFVSNGPLAMQVDDDNRLWVVCTGYVGDFDKDWNLIPGTSRPGGVHVIDLRDYQEIGFIELESAEGDLSLVEHTREAFINSGGARVIDMDNFEIEADTLVPGNFYSMKVTQEEEPVIYLADAVDFSSNGIAYKYSRSGNQLGSFETGIIPGDFLFIYEGTVTPIEKSAEDPLRIRLHQNFPNPFNPSTRIQFDLRETQQVRLEVFDSTGQRVAVLTDGIKAAGRHVIDYEATGLSSGVYYYRLKSENLSYTRKMTIIK